MQASDAILAHDLREIGLEDLAERALAGEWNDEFSDHALPHLELIGVLREDRRVTFAKRKKLIMNIRAGKYDTVIDPLEGVEQAPWSSDQVRVLNKFQRAAFLHPFTCRKRSEHLHNEGLLVATREGWHCPATTCDYVQTWAYGIMLDEERIDAHQKWLQQMFADPQ